MQRKRGPASHHLPYVNLPIELAHEGDFHLSTPMVVGAEVFDKFVKTLVEERPETIDRTKVTDLFQEVQSPMMIGFKVLVAINLSAHRR